MIKIYNSMSKKTVTYCTCLQIILIVTVLACFSGTVYSQTVYTFTNAGATGRTGSTQVQVNAAYSGSSLAGDVTINTQGVQEWMVPVTGNYSTTFVKR